MKSIIRELTAKDIEVGDVGFTREEYYLFSHYRYLFDKQYGGILETLKKERGEDFYRGRKGRTLLKRDALRLMISQEEEIQIKEGVPQCPLCGLHIKDMGAHVEKVHGESWEIFKKNFNWIYPRIFYTEQHRYNLSENKKHFYNETEAGASLKKQQSEKVSGEKNPACRDEVKLKISRGRMGKGQTLKAREAVSSNIKCGVFSDNAKSFGYVFHTIWGNKEYRFRSKVEYTIFLMLRYYNIPAEYESLRIEYYDPSVEYLRHYLVDYVIRGKLYEVKDSLKSFLSDPKYELIENQLMKIGKKLDLLTPFNFFEKLEIPESEIKPLSFFEKMILQNLKEGVCILEFPCVRPLTSYVKSGFVKKLGEDPLKILEEGRKIYENKKSSCNL